MHYFELGSPGVAAPEPGQAYVFGADGRLALAPPARGRALTMERIQLIWPIPTRPNRSRTATTRCCRSKMVFDDGGAYALLGPSGCGKTTMLNIMSGLLVPSHGKGAVRWPRRDDAPRPQEPQHCPGVPVPGDLRHHDGGREPGLPAEEPQRCPRRRSAARGQIAEMLEMSGQLDQRVRRACRPTKQNLAGPWPGALGCGGGAV